MSGASLAITGFTVMLALMALRLPIGLAMLVVGSAGYIQLNGLEPFLNYIRTTPYQIFANYTLSVIPLFVLMGAFAERSGLAGDLFKAASAFVGHRRGGLGMAMIGACTGFGAICGSSVATTATFARAALPQLRGYRYDPGFACGVTAVGGTLGILIPPSVILVVYAISTEQNIAKLFQAALIPGLLAATFYCITIWIMSRIDGTLAPAHERTPWRERWPLLIGIIPALLVAVVVVGGIYGGVFTPTEGASVGAFVMLVIGLVRRTLTPAAVRQAILQTAETSAMIFAILLGRRSSMPSSPDPGADRGGGDDRRFRLGALHGADRPAAVLYRARRGDGRAGDDPADAASVLPDRDRARFRNADGRCRDLVRHPRADRRRHRHDLPTDRPQRLRHLRHRP
jgi:TRAP-type mannitol/chloroaromatic compound transport system permease large subunit